MQPRKFAYLLTSWLSPGVVAHAARDWSDPPQGHEVAALNFKRGELRVSSDGRIGWFVTKFLENFQVSEELRLLSAGLYPREINDSAAQWLAEERLFTGDVEFHDNSDDCDWLYTVHAPVCEIRLVWPCLAILHKLVTAYYQYYRRVLDQHDKRDLHFPPHGEWPFTLWIGSIIAESFGISAPTRVGLPPPASMTHMLSNVRGTAIINGLLPLDSNELALMALVAETRYKPLSNDHALFESYVNR